MDFAFTEDHLALREAVRRFCDGEYPAAQRGHAEETATAARRRAGLSELGLFGLTLPAAYGGSAQGEVEAMLVAQELGRALVAAPWLASSVMAAPLLAEQGTAAQQQRWLAGLARGEHFAALACFEPEARYATHRVNTTATRQAGGWQLNGRKAGVLGGDEADLLLIVARSHGAMDDPDGLSLFALPAQTPGLSRQPYRTLDARGAAHLQLQAVVADDAALIGPLHGAAPLIASALARTNAALCAEATGALEALLAQTCEHLRTRKQFGAPLARFQALQHQVAEMAMDLEMVKSMACAAAMALQASSPQERDALVHAAKAYTAQAARRCALAGIQLHGAMGMTDECRIGHYAKRLLALGLFAGDAAHHLNAFTLLQGAPA